MKKSRVHLLICLAVAALLLAGSVASAQEKVVLRFSWWGGDSRHRATVRAIERYMELNPHVEIRPEYSGWDGYHDKLTTQYAANSAPDISQLSISSVMEYASRNLILEVTPLIDQRFSSIDESLWSGFVDADGKVWAIPVGVNAVNIHYNKTMFEDWGIAPPHKGWTWDDVYAIAQKATRDEDGDGRPEIFGIDTLFAPPSDAVPVISYQWDNPFFRNDYKEPNLDAGSMETYLNLAMKFQKGRVAPSPDEIIVYTGSQTAFNQRQVAMSLQMLSNIELMQSLMEDELGAVPWPIAVETGKTGTYFKPSQAIIINKRSKHVDEAIKFVEWFLTSPEAALITTFERGVPSCSVQRDTLLNSDITDIQRKIVQWTNDVAEYVDVIPEMMPPGFLEIQMTVLELMQEAQYEVASIPDVVRKMQNRAAEILRRYNR
ncbi:MAG: extracellular solute-binding protein [Firmicutes bacterium]|nr:extracellular solute-binding protein [Bacillota bacterium]